MPSQQLAARSSRILGRRRDLRIFLEDDIDLLVDRDGQRTLRLRVLPVDRIEGVVFRIVQSLLPGDDGQQEVGADPASHGRRMVSEFDDTAVGGGLPIGPMPASGGARSPTSRRVGVRKVGRSSESCLWDLRDGLRPEEIVRSDSPVQQ